MRTKNTWLCSYLTNYSQLIFCRLFAALNPTRERMRIFLVLLFMTLPYVSHAKEGDWITRIEMKNMRTTDFVWLNSDGDIFWNTDLYTNAMP